MARKRLTVGSVARVMELDERQILAHYVHAGERGPFVQLYRCPQNWSDTQGWADCEKVLTPVIVGIGAAVGSGRWPLIGHIPPEPFVYPTYLMNAGPRSWYVFDGTSERFLGDSVPAELQQLEHLSVWSAELLEERLQTGINLLSYERIRNWPER